MGKKGSTIYSQKRSVVSGFINKEMYAQFGTNVDKTHTCFAQVSWIEDKELMKEARDYFYSLLQLLRPVEEALYYKYSKMTLQQLLALEEK